MVNIIDITLTVRLTETIGSPLHPLSCWTRLVWMQEQACRNVGRAHIVILQMKPRSVLQSIEFVQQGQTLSSDYT